MARKQRSKGTGTLFRKADKGPWIARYWDHKHDRREHSTRTTDRQAAERILSKLVADTALRRDLVVDPRVDRMATEFRRPLDEHYTAYFEHCRRVGLDEEHVASKRRHLDRLANVAEIGKLSDLTADALERYLSTLKDEKKSARSINFARQIAVAFMGWCVRTGRAEANPLKVVPKQDETRDRRRVRRPLTDDELSRLIDVARKHGRESWYLAAALAGLRRGDMVKLAWRDVNFAEGTLTIRHGKAKREDVIPMHPQLAESLRTHHAARPGLPTARVWPEAVGNLTRTKDFLRAGIAKLVPVLDADGNPIKICEGDKAKTKTRISAEDADGRVIDLHALRTTLGTQLARSGVTPQVAQKIMRHSDYRTTLRHYTVLGLNDTSKAMDSLPGVRPKSNEAQAATGTTDAGSADCRPYCQQLERENDNRSAKTRDGARGADRYGREQKSLKIAAFCDDARRGAEVERTRHQSNSWSAM